MDLSPSARHSPPPWTRWRCVTVAAILLYGCLELFFRALGHRASVSDDAALWARQRARLKDGQSEHLTLVGASRIAYGLDLELLDSRYPGREVVQLGIRAGALGPVFRDLDETMPGPGTLVVSLHPDSFMPSGDKRSQSMLRAWRGDWRAAQSVDRGLVGLLQSSSVLLREELRLHHLWRSLLQHGRLPAPSLRRTDLRRSIFAPRAWLVALRRGPEGRRAVAERRERMLRERDPVGRWQRGADEMLDITRRLLAKEVRVIFVHFPTSGKVREFGQVMCPEAQCWARVVTACRRLGCDTLHVRDHPELRSFQPPDNSHLAAEDKRAFTERLFDLIDVRSVRATFHADGQPLN